MSYANAVTGGGRRYWIVTTDCMAELTSYTKLPVGKERDISQGSILYEKMRNHTKRSIVANILDLDMKDSYNVQDNVILPVSEEDAMLLLSVKPSRERTQLMRNKRLLEEAKAIKVGSRVEIFLDSDSQLKGMVRKVVKSFNKPTEFVVTILDENTTNSRMDSVTVFPFTKLRLIDATSDGGNSSVNKLRGKKKKEQDGKKNSAVFYDEKVQPTQTKATESSPINVAKDVRKADDLSPPSPDRKIAFKSDSSLDKELLPSQTPPSSQLISSSPSSVPTSKDQKISSTVNPQSVQRTPPLSPFSARIQINRFPREQTPASSADSPIPPSRQIPEQTNFKSKTVASSSPSNYSRTSIEFADTKSARSSSERNNDLRKSKENVNSCTTKLSKTKDEKKTDTYSDVAKNSSIKTRSNEAIFAPKIESSTTSSSSPHPSETNSSSYKACLKSSETADINDYYRVAENERRSSENSTDAKADSLTDLERFLSMTSESIDDDDDDDNKPVGKDFQKFGELGVGSVVEVTLHGEPWYGVIKWIGKVDGATKTVAGVEMEATHTGFGDGSLGGKKIFSCPPKKAFFVYLHLCRKDSRFLDSLQIYSGKTPAAFGSIDCPAVVGDVPPLSYSDYIAKHFFRENRGIQGHHNSCYLDATLFSMFAFTPVFDSLLHRPHNKSDIDSYCEVQRVLKEEIVNPLRQNMYVRADRVMGLRTLLEKLSSVGGLTCEEKDPEEFLNLLLHQILKAPPFLKLNSGQESYFYQLFVEKNDNLCVPTVQQLFNQSFLTSDIKLKEIPSCLIIQMPRHGKQFKVYNRIFPSPILDVTDVLEDSPRQCEICGKVAQVECRECFYQLSPEFNMKAFCTFCNSKVHTHSVRTNHKPRWINGWEQFKEMADIPRINMELFAVVCIETSHYVAFVKCGNDADVPWCFFDSMADRKGEQNGYNIPKIIFCPELSEWLSEDGWMQIGENPDRQLPEMEKRLFGDAYLCMYQNSSVMMYQ